MVATALGVMLGVLVAIQAPKPSLDDWHWLDQFREAAFDRFMPVGDRPLVTYRSFRDLYQDVQEGYFTIGYGEGTGFDKDRLVATVVVPTGESIQQQLLQLHMKNRAASFDSLIGLVSVRRYTLNAQKCSAVRIRLDALSKVTISLPARDTFSLHPVLHRVVIDFGGTRVDATIEKDDNPLVRWATETASALLACAIDAH